MQTVAAQEKQIFELLTAMGHEQVLFCNDEVSGLRAIIAIHNTVLGPALGGTRMWEYASDYDALVDALRLSQGMTYKAAVSGLNLGGGKAVILGNPRQHKSEALFRRYGKFVESVNGKYITAEDVGTTKQDMEYISAETKHVTGLPEHKGGSGDPSPVTAYGVYMGMKATAKKTFGTDSLNGKKVVVQGVGNVGRNLVDHLITEGAHVTIADIFEDQISAVTKKHSSVKVASGDIFDLEMDIYAPCALGATLNDDSIARLKAAMVAGAANNQLKNTEVHGKMLQEKGIWYGPDFVVNAGGLMNVYSELEGYNREAVMAQTEKIFDTTLRILDIASNENTHPHEAAVRLADRRIAAIKHINSVL